MTLHGDGTGSRDYVFVQDTVSGIWDSQKLEAGEVCNLGTNLTWTTRELADMIEIQGQRLNVMGAGKLFVGTYDESRWGHVYCLRGSNEKMKRLTGWEPKTSLEAGIERTWQWMLGHGPVLYRGGETSDMWSHDSWEDRPEFGQGPGHEAANIL